MIRHRLFLVFNFIALFSVAQSEKVDADLAKYRFRIVLDSGWRQVSYKELEIQNPEGLSALENDELKVLKGYILKKNNSITEYPNVALSIISIPEGLFSKNMLIGRADTLFELSGIRDFVLNYQNTKKGSSGKTIWDIVSNGRNYYDSSKNVMLTLMTNDNDEQGKITLWSVTYFSNSYLANLMFSIKKNDLDAYLKRIVAISNDSGFYD
jgi:hypothetical protein